LYRNNLGNAYQVIVDQSVLTGIVDHVFSDHTNEILGLLGGRYDSDQNIVHVKHYCASVRDCDNIAVDSVECDGNEVVKAQTNFAEK
jgi:proteasome lid subunit RPN8/RPN11